MAVRKPVVRHFIACEDVVPHGSPRLYTLKNICYVLQTKAGEPFPFTLKKLVLFALLTDASGVHDLRVQIVEHSETGEEKVCWESKLMSKDFGNDPLQIHPITFRLNAFRFDHPGRYDFHLGCGGDGIAVESLLLRGAP